MELQLGISHPPGWLSADTTPAAQAALGFCPRAPVPEARILCICLSLQFWEQRFALRSQLSGGSEEST